MIFRSVHCHLRLIYANCYYPIWQILHPFPVLGLYQTWVKFCKNRKESHCDRHKKRQSQFEIMRCAFNYETRILLKVNLFKLTTMTINMTVVLQCFWTLSRKENTLTIFFLFWYPGMDTDSDTNKWNFCHSLSLCQFLCEFWTLTLGSVSSPKCQLLNSPTKTLYALLTTQLFWPSLLSFLKNLFLKQF